MSRELKKNIYAVGVQGLFDELIPLPHGTSYNSYLIKGSQKTALVDSVDPAKYDELLANLAEHDVKQLDYIVCNHAEQDHSGFIAFLTEKYPQATIVTNEKCQGFLIDILHIPENRFLAVKDGETLSLGGKTFEFILAPWVHWPETMFSFLKEDKALFSCDFLGSHLATTDTFACNDAVLEGAKRYYAEIMMPFRSSIVKHLQKLDTMDIDLIAPSHGPVHRKPFQIIDAYKSWSSEQVKNEAVIPWVSMHGSTEAMVKQPDRGSGQKGYHGQALQPKQDRHRRTGHLVGRRRHGGRRHFHRTGGPASPGAVCRGAGGSFKAQDKISGHHRLLRLGQQGGGDRQVAFDQSQGRDAGAGLHQRRAA